MQLVSICTIFVLIIMYLATNYQSVVVGTPSGFDSNWKFKIPKSAFVTFALVLILISSVRHGYIDTYAYKEMYINSRNDLAYVNSAPYGVEAGWLFFCYLLNFISPSPNLLLFISALIIIGANVYVIKKHSCDPVFSLMLFFCLEYMDTNNGLRQMVAAALCIVGFSLLTEKKMINYLFFVVLSLVAMQFHESVMVVFIIAVCVIGGCLNVRVIAALLMGVVFTIVPGVVSGYIGEIFSDSKYLNYLDMSFGMSYLRAFIVGIIPAIVAFYYVLLKKRRREKIEYGEGVLINILFINTVFTIMGLGMQYWARMAFYTAFAPFILMPKLLYTPVVRSQRSMVKAIALVCYFIFFAYNIYVNVGYGAIGDFYFDISFGGGY